MKALKFISRNLIYSLVLASVLVIIVIVVGIHQHAEQIKARNAAVQAQNAATNSEVQQYENEQKCQKLNDQYQQNLEGTNGQSSGPQSGVCTTQTSN